MLVERYIHKQLSSLPIGVPFPEGELAFLKQMASINRVAYTTLHLLKTDHLMVSQFFAVQDQTLATKQEVLQVAASLAASSHLLNFQAIVRAAQDAGLPIREMESDHLASGGVTGKLERTWYVLGDEESMVAEAIELGASSRALMQQLEAAGKKMIFLAQKQPKRLLGIFACDFQLIKGVESVVKNFDRLGVEQILFASEKQRITQGLANYLGIEAVHSEISLKERKQLIVKLEAESGRLALLCTPQTVSLAGPQSLPMVIGGEAPDGVLRFETLEQIPTLLEMSRTILNKAKKRFFWCKI